MNADALKKALTMAKGRPVFVATADGAGRPHLACAGKLIAAPEGRVLLTEWFCPGTMENIAGNPHISMVVWDQKADTGYQLLGEVERREDTAMLDGYVPQAKQGTALPQVQRRLLVRVDSVLDFRRAPHTDVEE